MKLYTEEQVREVLSNMLLTTEQVESILKELSPQDTPAIEDTIKNIDKKIKELENRRSNTIIKELYK